MQRVDYIIIIILHINDTVLFSYRKYDCNQQASYCIDFTRENYLKQKWD